MTDHKQSITEKVAAIVSAKGHRTQSRLHINTAEEKVPCNHITLTCCRWFYAEWTEAWMRDRFTAHGLWLRREWTRGDLTANVDAHVSVRENETLRSQMDKSVFCLQFLAGPQTRACVCARVYV